MISLDSSTIQVWLYNGKWYALGRQSETEWIVNSTNPLKFQIVYHGGDKKNKHKRCHFCVPVSLSVCVPVSLSLWQGYG